LRGLEGVLMDEFATNAAIGSAAPQPRFAFGENWNSYLTELDDARIAEAEKSLQWLLGRERLDGLSFVDIGSGSGLMSLAARRLGARVCSFDADPQSVECTAILRDRFFPGDRDWSVERGSVLDRNYLASLGKFNVAYSWGVLHHTGAMRDAIANAAELAAPGALFVVALYRRTRLCWLWKLEKRWYCHASARAQAVACGLYVTLMQLVFALSGRDFKAYVANYYGQRGMDHIHDVRDWLGGYPYESITPADVARQASQLGFEHVRSKVRPYSFGLFGSGCDEYVYRRAH
jgi:2-polyprenyl-6-hydroxyphenyl methylase/3-demethylubiquinone-9 3-methyltransferase